MRRPMMDIPENLRDSIIKKRIRAHQLYLKKKEARKSSKTFLNLEKGFFSVCEKAEFLKINQDISIKESKVENLINPSPSQNDK